MNENTRGEGCGCGPFGGLFGGDNNIIFIILILLFCCNGFGNKGCC